MERYISGVNHRLLQLQAERPADYYEVGFIRRMVELYQKMQASPPVEDRTKVGRHRKIGGYISHNTGAYGPALITTKAVALKPMLAELCWFLRGDTNIDALNQEGCHIWDEWADENGDLGLIYGYQWRYLQGLVENLDPESSREYATRDFDQVATLIQTILDKPADSGNIVCAWNVTDLEYMALRPCHTLWQVCVDEGKLDLALYQRSADWFLGVPFNAASYTILQCLLAHMTGLQPGKFHHYFGDTHLYDNHRGPVEEYLRRVSDEGIKVNPDLTVEFSGVQQYQPGMQVDWRELKELQSHQIKVQGYVASPAIKAPVAV